MGFNSGFKVLTKQTNAVAQGDLVAIWAHLPTNSLTMLIQLYMLFSI